MAPEAQLQSPAGLAAPKDAPGRCHVCGAKVVVKSPGEVVIKNAILRVEQGKFVFVDRPFTER